MQGGGRRGAAGRSRHAKGGIPVLPGERKKQGIWSISGSFEGVMGFGVQA